MIHDEDDNNDNNEYFDKLSSIAVTVEDYSQTNEHAYHEVRGVGWDMF